jgi:hypothetical protein
MKFKAFVFAMVVGAACTHARASTPTGAKHLCDIENGRWCVDCDTHECSTSTSSGWLCCHDGVCVVAQPSQCTLGVSGWCDSYVVQPDGSAQCEDKR